MKNLFFPIFLALTFFALGSCQFLGIGKSKTKPVDVTVLVNNKPTAGIEVKTPYFIERTDDNGLVQGQVKKSALNKNTTVSLKSKSFQIDTVFSIQISTSNTLNVRGKTSPLLAYDSTLRGNKDDFGYFKAQLETADAALKKLQTEVNEYLKKNPESVMKDFLPLIENRTQELKVLQQTVENINKKYEAAIKELPSGKFSDANFKELVGIYDRTKTNMDNFNTLVEQQVASTEANLRDGPEVVYPTDFFFKKGEYELSQLAEEQTSSLKLFRTKIATFIMKNHPDEKRRKDLVIKLRVTGYTDGTSVGDKLWEAIKKANCSSSEQRGDGNNCLSELRAKSLAKFFENDYKTLRFDIEAVGKGSILAQSGEDNYKLRKCVVSVAIYESALNANNSDKFGK